ncbi:hypothetical protein B0J14DRAFT_610931 [Halenospora varia]|nr:hypothetical protein B0J14DRAFT_610931 [Halenospora varia]
MRSQQPNSATHALPKYATPKIDVSSGPAMVTPFKLLQRDPQWIDCPFCKRMAKTKVTLKEEKEEPSGIMMCLVCLVCCPLLLCLPMMMGKTQSWTHACSSCNAIVAIRGQHGEIEVKEPLPSKLVPSKFGAANHASMAEAVAPIQNSAKAQ